MKHAVKVRHFGDFNITENFSECKFFNFLKNQQSSNEILPIKGSTYIITNLTFAAVKELATFSLNSTIDEASKSTILSGFMETKLKFSKVFVSDLSCQLRST